MTKHKASIFMATGVSRRRLIGWAGVGLVSGLMTSLSLPIFAAQQQVNADELDLFMRVSRALTGKRHLNPTVGSRLFQWMKTSQFMDHISKLEPLPTQPPHAWESAQQQTVRQILAGWYLGVVEQNDRAQVISYEQALMFDAVSDVLSPRSYCTNKPGYWQERPYAAGE